MIIKTYVKYRGYNDGEYYNLTSGKLYQVVSEHQEYYKIFDDTNTLTFVEKIWFSIPLTVYINNN